MNVAEAIKKALLKATKEIGVSPSDIALEYPAELSHGDYASNIALKIFGPLTHGNFDTPFEKNASWTVWRHDLEKFKNPIALASKIVALMGSIPGIAKTEIAGPGFINFTLASEIFAHTIEEARTQNKLVRSGWGSGNKMSGRKMMVEYTDPNPFKEFHIGHLMSNAIGESICRLFEVSGGDVKRANYQGDVGLHVAKAIYAYKQYPPTEENEIVKWGLAYKTGNDLYETNDEAKSAIDKINKSVYEHDQDVLPLYNEGRKVSLDYFETIYKKLGMEERDHFGETRYFDYYFLKSTSWEIGKAIVQLNTPNVFEESEGAFVFHGEKYDPSLHTRVFITSKGLPTYEAKELGLLKSKIDKWGWNFDESITITANEQEEYFRVVLAAARQIQELQAAADKTTHIVHGMMRFADSKMSSRTGNVITALGLLQDLFMVAENRAKESRAEDRSKLAHDVALAAIKYQILKQASGKNIIFDREKALSLDGDSGPYLQYAHARTCAILAKAADQQIEGKADVIASPNEVARLLHRFPEIVAYAADKLEPHLLTTYLTQLAAAFNAWYAQEHILDGSTGAHHKLALVEAVGRTLKNGLWLLAIPAPEKM